MEGKVCLITGTATGMGKIAARELAKLGATVICVDVDEPVGRASRNEIVALSRNTAVEFVHADISDYGQVRALAARVKGKYGSSTS
jgi:NAD(P)-dependent dehydrogenase (short-subunit alcohol dehydrogenase family)